SDRSSGVHGLPCDHGAIGASPQSMLAPPANRRRKRRKSIAVRRADDRRRKRKQLERERQELHHCTLCLPAILTEGLTRQFILDRRLTDREADDHCRFEIALTHELIAQARRWVP